MRLLIFALALCTLTAVAYLLAPVLIDMSTEEQLKQLPVTIFFIAVSIFLAIAVTLIGYLRNAPASKIK